MISREFEIIKRVNLFRLMSFYYWNFEFNISHINGKNSVDNPNRAFKTASHDIETLKYNRQNQENLFVFDWHSATGIGAIAGIGNNRCIDIDYISDDSLLKNILFDLNLPNNYEWVVWSGSKQGYHIWINAYKTEDYFDRGIFGTNLFKPNKNFIGTFRQLEYRWNSHVVLPPSINSHNNIYEFLNCDMPQQRPLHIDEQIIFKTICKYCEPYLMQSTNNYEIANSNIFSPRSLPWYGSEPSNPQHNIERTTFIDLETTGLPKDWNAPYDDLLNWPYVVQVGWINVRTRDDAIFEEDSEILKPKNFIIDSDSSKVHGVTHSIAHDKGIDRRYILDYLSRMISISSYVVAHNTDFDISVLRCEFLRNNIHDPFLKGNHKLICTMKSSVDFCKISSPSGGYKWPKLSELYYKLFKEDFSGAHDALYDIKATYECYVQLRKIGIIKMHPILAYDEEPYYEIEKMNGIDDDAVF
jgi:DNA polymerase III epsilon subunit-like protein